MTKPSDSYRILHTADWHLGKTLEGQSREEEHDLSSCWQSKLANSSKMKSSKGHQYVFQSSDRSKFKYAMKNYDKAVGKFNEALGDLISNADRVLKG